jgi:pseudouridylate synthase
MNDTPILCIGSVLWDIIGRSAAAMRLGSDVPGRITRLPGGVAMNIAMTLCRFGLPPALLTAIGRDAEGDDLMAACHRMGIDCAHVYRSDDLPTDRYMAVEGANGLIAAIADAHSLEAAGAKILAPLADGRLGSADRPFAGTVALDGNLTEALLSDIAGSALFAAADLRVAPASPGKAERLLPLLSHPRATLYVNLEEAGLLAKAPYGTAPEVAAALAAGRPVVALESTIITHGMPWPQNVATARAVEDAVRDAGATPATIAVMGGRIHIGLSSADLDQLGQAQGVAKLSRADLAICLASGATGATTVAATMICAHLAGIAVFATGGIGGVHRGAETTFDISADLRELALTPVTVVAAGAKAILDLPKTLEVLETYGVPVIAVGQDGFPAFWSRASGLPAPLRMDDPTAIAAAHLMRARLGLPGGQLVANPIPAADEIPRDVILPAIEAALADAAALGIAAKQVTPFLLQRIFEITEGRSLAANIALVLNNARLGAAIAAAIARNAGIAPA